MLAYITIEILAGIAIFLLGMLAYGYTTKAKLKESSDIAHAAYIDALTGMGNRYKFNKVMQRKVADKEKKFALCFLDLDDFKQINDNMGHDAGDELLIALAKRLEESLEGFGEVYRLGGDEYAMLINNAESKLEVETLIKRVQRSVVQPIEIRGNKINLEYSMGIAMFPTDSENADELVNFADSAMYHIKESGKSNYYFHNPALKSQTDNKRRMERELKEAYKNNEFEVEYQPRIDLKNPDKICLESFLYWNHPMVGKLRAKYFLKYAETIGLIIPIDEYIVEKSLELLSDLKRKGHNNVSIAMNLSIRHFQRKDFVDKLCNILDNNKFVKDSITFQITNDIDTAKVESYKIMFDKIAERGVRISTSNYQIKYEDLDVFRRLPISEVKVNSDYLASNSIFKKDVLKDIVQLSRDLNYTIVITKVSDERTLKEILKQDIDMIQGNYLFEHIETNKLEQFIEQYNSYKGDIKKIIKKGKNKEL